MEQGSNAWLEWRHEGLGSSDAPVIMEAEGAYTTRHKLYLEKTGQAPPKSEKDIKSKEFIFAKGHKIEEMVRGRYEIKENTSYSAALFQRQDKPYIKSSMDLANKELRKGKEVKYVSLEEFDAGICPPRYYPQIQEQYLCTDFLEIDLVLATDYMWVNEETKDEKVKIPTKENFRTKEVKVPLDQDYCIKLYNAMVDFWENHVLKKVPPALSEKDAVTIKDKIIIDKLKKYAANIKKIDKVKSLEKENKKLVDEIFASEAMNHPIMIYKKIKITKSLRKGSIEYKNIPAIAKMSEEELEKFRGADTYTRSIKC